MSLGVLPGHYLDSFLLYRLVLLISEYIITYLRYRKCHILILARSMPGKQSCGFRTDRFLARYNIFFMCCLTKLCSQPSCRWFILLSAYWSFALAARRLSPPPSPLPPAEEAILFGQHFYFLNTTKQYYEQPNLYPHSTLSLILYHYNYRA